MVLVVLGNNLTLTLLYIKLQTEMSFSIKSFTADPFIRAFSSLKQIELTQLAGHVKLTIASGARKVRNLPDNYKLFMQGKAGFG